MRARGVAVAVLGGGDKTTSSLITLSGLSRSSEAGALSLPVCWSSPPPPTGGGGGGPVVKQELQPGQALCKEAAG